MRCIFQRFRPLGANRAAWAAQVIRLLWTLTLLTGFAAPARADIDFWWHQPSYSPIQLTLGDSYAIEGRMSTDAYHGVKKCSIGLPPSNVRGAGSAGNAGNDGGVQTRDVDELITSMNCDTRNERLYATLKMQPGYYTPGQNVEVEAKAWFNGTFVSEKTRTIKFNINIASLYGTTTASSQTIAHDQSTFHVGGTVSGGANRLVVYRVYGAELGRFDSSTNYSGDVDVSAIKPGESWNLSIWAAMVYPATTNFSGGTHWHQIKSITLTKALSPTPTPGWSYPSHGSWHNLSSDLSIGGTTVSDAKKLRLWWRREGGSWQQREQAISGGSFSATIPGSSTDWADGTYQITFNTQISGHAWSPDAPIRSVHVERTPPVMTWNTPADGAAINGALNVTGTLADSQSGPGSVGLQLKADGDASWSNPVYANADSQGSFSYNFGSALVEGRYRVRATGYDKAGNATAAVERGVVIDRTQPEVSITAPAHNDWFDGKHLTVKAQVSDALSGVKTVQLGLWRPGMGNSAPYVYSDVPVSSNGVLNYDVPDLPGGERVHILVSATDHAGNTVYAPSGHQNSGGLIVYYDGAAPTVTWRDGLAAGQTAWFNTGSVVLGGTAQDNQSGVAAGQYRWRSLADVGAAWTESAWLPADTAGAFSAAQAFTEQSAAYEVQIRAKDRAQNVSAWSASAFVKVKTTVPVVQWAATGAVDVAGTSITVRGKLTDAYPAQATVKIGWGETSAAWQYVTVAANANGTFAHTFANLDAATYEFKLLATDVAGNAATPTDVRQAMVTVPIADALADFTVTPRDIEDLDGSGGLTPGDTLVYRIAFKAQTFVKNFQLTMTLPDGLERGDKAPYLADSAMIDNSNAYSIGKTLNANWTGQGSSVLLVKKIGDGSPDLYKNDTVVLDVPVRVKAGASGEQTAQIEAWAAQYAYITGEAERSVPVALQYPAAQALAVSLAAPDLKPGKTPPGTAFDAVLTLKAPHWAAQGARLAVVLPAALQRNGTPVFDATSGLAAGLNPGWQGSGAATALLADNVTLPAGKRAVIRIPVKLEDDADGATCSTATAGAANVHGTQQATLCIDAGIAHDPAVAWDHGLQAGQTVWRASSDVTLGGATQHASAGQYRWRTQGQGGSAWQTSAWIAIDANGKFAGTQKLAEQNSAYEIQLRAKNEFDVESAWSASAFVKVKTTPPAVAWAASGAITVSGASVAVQGQLTDAYPAQAIVRIGHRKAGDPTWPTWQYTAVSAASDGRFSHTFANLAAGAQHEFQLLATDAAGMAAEPSDVRTAWITLPILEAIGDFAVSRNGGEDLDGSGGLTPGDALTARLQFKVLHDVTDFQLSLALPAGLERDTRPGKAPRLDAASHIDTSHANNLTTALNLGWTGQNDDGALLVVKHPNGAPTLKAGDVVVLDAPARVSAGASGTLALNARAWSPSAGSSGQLDASTTISLQTSDFPVDKAIAASIAPDGLAPGLTPLGTPFTYVITMKALNWPVTGARVRYALPPGLHRNGTPAFGATSAINTGLNPQWQGTTAADALLADGVNLDVGQQAVIRVPVKLDASEVGELCSEIEALAANVRGTQWQGHFVETDIEDELLRFNCPRPRASVLPVELSQPAQ